MRWTLGPLDAEGDADEADCEAVGVADDDGLHQVDGAEEVCAVTEETRHWQATSVVANLLVHEQGAIVAVRGYVAVRKEWGWISRLYSPLSSARSAIYNVSAIYPARFLSSSIESRRTVVAP